MIRLTKRQKMVVELMIEGLGIKQIAAKMGIAERTVKEFRAQAKERFGARTCCELVAKYIRNEHRDPAD